MYSTDEKHPLATPDVKILSNVANFTLSPPCTLITIAKDNTDFEKLPSEAVVVHIKKNLNNNSVSVDHIQNNAMVRPLMGYDLGMSGSSSGGESIFDVDYNPNSNSSRFRR